LIAFEISCATPPKKGNPLTGNHVEDVMTLTAAGCGMGPLDDVRLQPGIL